MFLWRYIILRKKHSNFAKDWNGCVFLGFFNMWGFGRVNKQACHSVKKQQENATSCSLELIGDLIGHSSSVEVLLLIGMSVSRGSLLFASHCSFISSQRPKLSSLI